MGLLVAAAWPSSLAVADPGADLARAHYDFAVVEYCGLVNPPVAMGYHLLHHDLMARGNIRPDQDRAARVQALQKADYDYQDWGLSGNKKWCGGPGARAAGRFVSYFQFRRLPQE
jgi:hypothetical protein